MDEFEEQTKQLELSRARAQFHILEIAKALAKQAAREDHAAEEVARMSRHSVADEPTVPCRISTT